MTIYRRDVQNKGKEMTGREGANKKKGRRRTLTLLNKKRHVKQREKHRKALKGLDVEGHGKQRWSEKLFVEKRNEQYRGASWEGVDVIEHEERRMKI